MNKKNLTEAQRAKNIYKKLVKLVLREEKELAPSKIMIIYHYLIVYLMGVMIEALKENPRSLLSEEKMIEIIIKDARRYAGKFNNTSNVEH